MNTFNSRGKKTVLFFVLSILLILSLSAFSFPTKSSLNEQSHHAGKGKSTFYLKPGQDVWFNLPVKDPKNPHSIVAIHAEVSNSLAVYAVSPNSSCRYGASIRETAYEVTGDIAYWYQLSLNFCYNGTSVTSISQPIISKYTNTFYGVDNTGAYTYNYGSSGYGYSTYHACYFGCINTHDGYVEVDVYGNGSWSGQGN